MKKMNHALKFERSIEINANPSQIWNVLTDPEKIKLYLYGTETVTNWKVGSSIRFKGEYEGTSYEDKGKVLNVRYLRELHYNYWSGFSGLEDIPVNYSRISYTIELLKENHCRFTWRQKGFSSEEGRQHAESGMEAMLEQIKQLAENT